MQVLIRLLTCQMSVGPVSRVGVGSDRGGAGSCTVRGHLGRTYSLKAQQKHEYSRRAKEPMRLPLLAATTLLAAATSATVASASAEPSLLAPHPRLRLTPSALTRVRARVAADPLAATVAQAPF